MFINEMNIDGETFPIAFKRAEKMLKRFERIGGKTLDPAINQLRYASRHFVEALEADKEADRIESLRKALSHCHRAEYDSIDAAVAVIGANLVDFDSRYLESSICSVIPDYADLYSRAKSYLARLSLEDAPRDIKSFELGVYGKELDALVDIWASISAKCPLVEKLDLEKRLEIRATARRHMTNVLLAILGIVVTILVGIVAKLF